MIGLFDSGVGGLSVLRHIRAALPHEHLLYVADQAHVPYGPRPAEEICAFSEGITRFLLAQGARLIVIPCNTASAAALTYLRQTFPDVPFVGMEPAVKPAAAQTKSGKVGILATVGTFESQRYTELMARFAQGIELHQDPCIGLVGLIEAGLTDTPETEQLLKTAVFPMLQAGVDTLVLGCTHYPFVIPTLERVAGTAVSIIDPAPAIVRQTRHLLHTHQLQNLAATPGTTRFVTTGQAEQLALRVQQLLRWEVDVETAVWQYPTLSLASFTIHN